MSQNLFESVYYAEDELRACGFKTVGKNVRIHQHANIFRVENIAIGSHVRIDPYVSLIATGPVTLGSFIHIGSYCLLSAGEGIVMEDFTTLSQGVKIYTHSDDYSGEHLTNPMVPAKYTGVQRGPVVLKRHVIIGSGTVILPGVTIGEGSSVGALSLVKESLPAWGVYAGIPVRRLRARSQALLKLEAELLAEIEKEGL